MIASCPHCRATVITTVDAPRAGVPITIDPTPTTADYAALALAAGYQAVVTERDRNGRRTYHHLNPPRQPRPGHAHHVQHICGHHPPPAPPPPRPEIEETW